MLDSRRQKTLFFMLSGTTLLSLIAPLAHTQMPDISVPSTLPTTPAAAPNSRITLSDGLALTLPPSWKIITLSPAAASNETPDGLALLLHARPANAASSAFLTVLRESAGNPPAPATRPDFLRRLNEISAGQGFRPEQSTDKGNDNLAWTQVTGVSGDGQRRLFTAVTFSRPPKTSLRFYWQRDDSDVVARMEFDACLASMTFDGIKVSQSLAGAEEHIVSNPSPAQPATATANVFGSSQPGTAAATPPTTISAQTADMVTKNRETLVVIEGDKGMGSGFVCNQDGQTWLLTNAHVLSGNPNPRFKTMNGAKLTLAPTFLAVDHDLCKVKLAASSSALEVMSDMDATAKIGDAIVVLGNAEGAGVIHPFEGHIVGLGPNLVEVDAPFVPGNSGSPIIHQATGKVIGIATYLVTRKVDTTGKDDVQTTVRRFGYRIDNVKLWEPVNWARFQAQALQAESIESNGNEFVKLFADARNDKMLSSSYSNPGIQRALDNFRSRIQGGHLSLADVSYARRELLANLRVATLSDINTFDSRGAYDYFRREIAVEKKFRDDIYTGFTRVLNSQ